MLSVYHGYLKFCSGIPNPTLFYLTNLKCLLKSKLYRWPIIFDSTIAGVLFYSFIAVRVEAFQLNWIVRSFAIGNWVGNNRPGNAPS